LDWTTQNIGFPLSMSFSIFILLYPHPNTVACEVRHAHSCSVIMVDLVTCTSTILLLTLQQTCTTNEYKVTLPSPNF